MNSFRNLHQPTGRHLMLDEVTYLFFGGTAYLGLLNNPAYIELYKMGIDRYGLNNGTSRSNNIQLGIYNEAEEKMAFRFGFEASAIFSSGYLAAQAAVKVLIEGREIIYAPGSHPALWLDRNPNEVISFHDWSIQIIQYINSSTNTKFIIVSNCIDNLKPEKYDFSIFTSIHTDKEVLLLLDDSHGLGVVHHNAVSSDLKSLGNAANIDIVVVSSLAKGLGTDAGLVLGSTQNIEKIKRHPIFLGASPASPAGMYALLHGDAIYDEAFKKLHANIDFFLRKLPVNHGLSHIDDFPVFSSLDPELYVYLCENNILISSFPYPLPTSPVLNRIVISSLHTEFDLNTLSEIIFSKGK